MSYYQKYYINFSDFENFLFFKHFLFTENLKNCWFSVKKRIFCEDFVIKIVF